MDFSQRPADIDYSQYMKGGYINGAGMGGVKKQYDKDMANYNAYKDSSEIMNNFGLGEQGVNSLYDKYSPQQLQNPGQYDQAADAVNRIYGNATSTAPSQWANAEYASQRAGEAEKRDTLSNQLQGMEQNAYSQLASSGGLDSGARERLASGLNDKSLFAQQGISGAGERARLGITSKDMQNKQNMLMQSPGMFGQIGDLMQGTDRFNINNQNAYNTNRMNSIMDSRDKSASLFADTKANQPKDKGFWGTVGDIAKVAAPIAGMAFGV